MWDMLTELRPFTQFLDAARRLRKDFAAVPNQTERLSDEMRTALWSFLVAWRPRCHDAGLVHMSATLQHAIGPYDADHRKHITIDKRLTAHEAVDCLTRFINDFKHDVKARLCFVVPSDEWPSDAKHDAVADRFSSALIDLVEAEKCYAFDLYRACVFHAVRAAENGLKAFARAAGVMGDLDFKEIGGIIKKIEEALEKLDVIGWEKGQAKSDAQDFFHGGLADARYINQLRGSAIHVRTGTPCEPEEAARALRRSREFLERLAVHTSEQNEAGLTKDYFAARASGA
jgi:hypothetical protein